MKRHPLAVLSTLALATLGLAACGGGDDEDPTSGPVTAPEGAPEAPTDDTQEEQAPPAAPTDEVDSSDASDDAEGSDAPADATADPGPAPEGAVIPTGAEANPPGKIGEYSLMDGSGPAFMYTDEDSSTMISVGSDVMSSPYDALVAEIETDNIPAGTGSCGTDEAGTSITCYQRTKDGVLNLNAVPEEISVEEMAVFVNQYVELVGVE